MQKNINSSLQTAVKGSSFVFLGMIISLLLWFIIKILIARYTTNEEFGLYSLTITLAGFLTAISFLGVQEGTARYISLFLGKGGKKDADSIARASIHIGFFACIIAFSLLFFLADIFARYIFYKPEITLSFRIIAFIIPFSVLAGITSNILRGHGIIQQKVFYQDIGQPFSFLCFLIAIFVLKLPYIYIVGAFTLSVLIVFLFISATGHKKLGPKPFLLKEGQFYRELLKFSIPILFVSIFYMVLGWTDTLMLGRYSDAAKIGTYQVSISLAKLLSFPLEALGYVFLPIASMMHAQGQSSELNKTYQILTKWVFSFTLPIFFILFFFPEMTIQYLFGDRFLDASIPLRILAFGFLINVFLGTNGMLMMALGMSKTIMKITLIGSLMNIFLNYIFIKHLGLGLIGASSATFLSYLFINSSYSSCIYRAYKIHPFTSSYLKPLLGAAITGVIIYAIAKNLPLYFWMMPLYLVLFLFGYAVSIIITKSIHNEDIFIFEMVMKKIGIPSDSILGFLRKLAIGNN